MRSTVLEFDGFSQKKSVIKDINLLTKFAKVLRRHLSAENKWDFFGRVRLIFLTELI